MKPTSLFFCLLLASLLSTATAADSHDHHAMPDAHMMHMAAAPHDTSATRHDVQAEVHEAWIRHLPGDLPDGGYFTLRNTGTQTLVLTGATSPAFAMVMLHESSTQGMRHVESVMVAPGQSLAFAPGHYHLMLTQAQHDIAVGQRVDVTLLFADGGKLDVPFEVRDAAGRPASGSTH